MLVVGEAICPVLRMEVILLHTSGIRVCWLFRMDQCLSLPHVTHYWAANGIEKLLEHHLLTNALRKSGSWTFYQGFWEVKFGVTITQL